MNFKTTYGLFCVLLGMLGLFGLMVAVKKPGTDVGHVFPSFFQAKAQVDVGDIDTVEIERKDAPKIVFIRKGDDWYLQDPDIRLQGPKVNLLLREIIDARREEDTDVSADFKRFGLEHPKMEIVLKASGTKKGGDSREWKLDIGKQSPEKEGVVFVASSERPGEVLAVQRSNLPTLLHFKLDDFRSTKLLEASPLNTQVVTLTDNAGKKKRVISLKRNATGGYRFLKPEKFGPAAMEGGLVTLGKEDAKQSPGVRGLLQAIDGLEAIGFQPLGQKDFEKYGVQDGARGLRIFVQNTQGAGPLGRQKKTKEEATLLIGKPVEKTDKNDKKKEIEYYARLLSDQAVVRVSDKNLKTLRDVLQDNGQELRSLKLTDLQSAAADAIDIHNSHGLIQFRRDKDSHWKVSGPSLGQVRTATNGDVQDLLNALSKPNQIKQFRDQDSATKLGLDDPPASVKVWVDGLAQNDEEDKPAKKEAGKKKPAEKLPRLKKGAVPVVTVLFGKATRDRDLVFAQRETEGVKNKVEVPVTLLTQVNRDPLAYLDRNVTGFTTRDVTELVRTHGKSIYEVAREKNGDRWQLIRPKGVGDYADRDNVGFLLSKLTKLHVVRWVKVKPTRADLVKYGLDDPGLTIKVTLKALGDKKPETRTFKFGKEVFFNQEGKVVKPPPGRGPNPPQPGVYGQAGTDVFLARALEYADMRDIELRDRSIFRFAPETVTRLKLEGLDNPKDPTQAITFEVARDEENWKTVKPKGFDTDADKILPFLTNLANLKVTRFVAGEAKAEYGLGKNAKGKPQWTLRIEVALQGDEKPLILTLGKATGKDYYARSSRHGDEVFLVPAAAFQPLFEKPPWLRFFKKPGQ